MPSLMYFVFLTCFSEGSTYLGMSFYSWVGDRDISTHAVVNT
jgi:hypothetical protein